MVTSLIKENLLGMNGFRGAGDLSDFFLISKSNGICKGEREN